MSIPFFNQLREIHKNAVIFAISKSWVSPIYTNHPDISEIISFEKKDLFGLRSTKNSGLSLKSLDLDIFYLLSDSFRSAYIARKSEAPIIIGYPGQGRTQMLTKVISRPKNKTHRTICCKFINCINIILGKFVFFIINCVAINRYTH